MQDSSPKLARYEVIAGDIAGRITRGEYPEGSKFSGRSTLAAKYNVSPETIRRAIAILESKGIVKAMPGVGVIIKSKKNAEIYLGDLSQVRMLQEIQTRIHLLLREKQKLDLEIENLLNTLVNYTFKANNHLQKVHEVEIPKGSHLIGKTISDSKFRTYTGCNIIAVERDGKEIFSPDSHFIFQAQDLLVFLSLPEYKERAKEYVQASDINRISYKEFNNLN